ncbi:MAG TPA: hypothetical protein PKH16_06145 [Aequorivita sp.]|nr:hypothetical protein [Aequorivita sp.]
MKNEFNKRKILTALILSLILLFTIFGNYYTQQISEWANPISTSILLGLILFIAIKLILWIIKIYKSRTELKLKALIPFFVYAITILLVFISPNWLYADNYLSEIKYRGCYEGTINTGTIYFRESGEFEYRHVGFFGFTTFEKGIWTKSGDTIRIEYKNEVQKFVGDKLIITESEFINISSDTINKNTVRFYRGYCKGLN